MAQQNVTINVNARKSGKHFSRQARMEKIIPAVVYGPNFKPLNLSLAENDAIKFGKRAYENTIFTFVSEDKALNGIKVLRKAIANHPLSRRPIHLDFYALDMSKAVRVNVELRFIGKAMGTGEGGLFSAVRRDVEVECLPTAIPEFFEVDVTPLGLNQSLHVSDVKLSGNVKLITSAQETIATCSVVEEVVAQVAPAAAAAAPAAAATGDKKAPEKK